jgi:hypothetical protein
MELPELVPLLGSLIAPDYHQVHNLPRCCLPPETASIFSPEAATAQRARAPSLGASVGAHIKWW